MHMINGDHGFVRLAVLHIAANAAAVGGAHRATAIAFVSAFSRLPLHPVTTKANNRAMILIRAIPFCQVSKRGYAAKGMLSSELGCWKYDPRETGKKRDITPYLWVHPEGR
jgi:hypothetical protein